MKWRHTLLTEVVIKRWRGDKGNWTFIISNWLGDGGLGGSARRRLMTPFKPERDRGADRLKVTLVGKRHQRRAVEHVAPHDPLP